MNQRRGNAVLIVKELPSTLPLILKNGEMLLSSFSPDVIVSTEQLLLRHRTITVLESRF